MTNITPIEPRYYYKYAEIELDTGLCISVRTTTRQINNPALIEIPVYDENYIDKYYINGAWYEDAAGTIPWQSSLL
jgi:hypothetical protein